MFCRHGTEWQPLSGKTVAPRLGNTVVPNSKTVPTSAGTANSTTASADENLFSGQILPVDDQWWKAFNDPVLDSLISVASGENYSVLAAIDRMEQARASLRMERSNFSLLFL